MDSQKGSLESKEHLPKKRRAPSCSSASTKVDYKEHSDSEGTVYSSEDDQFRLTKKACSSPYDDDNVLMAMDADNELKVDDDEELAEAIAVDGDEAEVVAPV